MIEVSELRKSYGSVEALRGVSFDIAAGQIVGLLGPNGAGKTTIIKILTGYLQPDVGTVTVDGLDVLTQTRAVQARIGYLPENAPLYPELSVQAYLKMMADLRQIPAAEQLAAIGEAVQATGLYGYLTALQGLSAARRAGAGHPAQAKAAHPRRADRRAGPHADHRDPRPDPASGEPCDRPLLDAHPVRGRGALRPRHHPHQRPHQDRCAAGGSGGHRGRGRRPGEAHGRLRADAPFVERGARHRAVADVRRLPGLSRPGHGRRGSLSRNLQPGAAERLAAARAAPRCAHARNRLQSVGDGGMTR